MGMLSSMAVPGGIPTAGAGREAITPESLFRSATERAAYQRLLDQGGQGAVADVKVKKVKVEIFDLSDPKDVKKYEKLWSELLEKAARMEVVVESRKDLVHRADGTSYWMKYVEYVEFGDDLEKSEKAGSANGR